MRKPAFAPRRIVVALDASPASQAALEAAGSLALRLHAELLGVFVEDVNLLRLAELPFAPHFSLSSGTDMRLDMPGVESQLRGVAEQARAALEAVAARLQVSGSFRVARGSVSAELLAATAAGDLLILGRASRSLIHRERLGGTARAAAQEAAAPVLLLPPRASLEGPVLAVYDGSAESERALEIAARLAEALEEKLVVIASAASEPAAAELAAVASRQLLAQAGGSARVQAVADGERLRRALDRERMGVLVLGARSPLLREADLLDRIRCAVLLTR